MIEVSNLSETRAAYDTVAADYAELLRDALAEKPLDRAVLGAFADLVRAGGRGPVVDLGCGPGRITAHLKDLGLDVFGVDLSPEMIAVARRSHPKLRFEEGDLTAPEWADNALAGVVAWYSIIHIPPAQLAGVFSGFHRVLAPGGHLLLAFQSGEDELVRLHEAYGHQVSCDVYRLSPHQIVERLGEAGFAVHSRMSRGPEGAEKTRQCFVVARKPAAS